MASDNPLHPIPSPPRKFMIGNMLSVRANSPIQDMMNYRARARALSSGST